MEPNMSTSGLGGMLPKGPKPALPSGLTLPGMPGSSRPRVGGPLSFGTHFLEKQAVVIDFGHALTKVGFAVEGRPRHFLRTPELRQRRRVSDGFTSTPSESEWVEVLGRLLHEVFFHYLSVSPKDRRVIVCDAIASAAPFRRALAAVLFERFAAPSVAFMADLVMPLYLTGLSSGLVVDLGYDCARVFATYACVPIYSSYCAARCGGRHVNALLREALRGAGRGDAEDVGEEEAWLEDVKSQACYVRCQIASAEGRPSFVLDASSGTQFGDLTINEDCRTGPCEVFFAARAGAEATSSPCEFATVPEAIAESLERLEIDVRALVVQNIVVCGGGAMLPGLLPRLAVELQAALRQRKALEALAEHLLFTPLDFAPVIAVWAGAAVCGAMGNEGDYMSKDWADGRPLPDWVEDGYL